MNEPTTPWPIARLGVSRVVGLGAALVLGCVVSGCGFVLPDRIHYEWQPTASCDDCASAVTLAGADQSGSRFLGLGLSGGGSRAAVFAAAVLEALESRGLARKITHLSSVSGGGFAASYFVANPIASACQAVGAKANTCQRDYFAAFQAAMRHDYATDTFLNQLTSPDRITSPTRRASSLQEALDERYLGGVTFGDLPPFPVLLINAASYDDNRRFVFSNIVLPEIRPDSEPFVRDPLRLSSFSLADCPQPTPPDLPVSLAVTASASFPPVIGPVVVQAQRSCADATAQYWHLGDGGIIDNTGADTLHEMVVRRMHGTTRLASALILIADAGAPPDPEGSLASRDLSVFTSNPGAVVDMAQARATAYADVFWSRERAEASIPFDAITFRFTEARITEWPASCAARTTEWTIDHGPYRANPDRPGHIQVRRRPDHRDRP